LAYVGNDIIHSNVKCAIDYISDKKNGFKKVTEEKDIKSEFQKIIQPDEENVMYIYCDNCTLETAEEEWNYTQSKSQYHLKDDDKNVVAYHIWQSFAPGEVTPEQAHEIGKAYADKLFGGKYQYIVATHLDKDHYHNHILFCSVDYVNHKKFRCIPPGQKNATINKWRKVSDEICKDFGLGIINEDYIKQEAATKSAKSEKKYKDTKSRKNSKSSTNNRAQLRSDIDKVLQKVDTYEEFLEEMSKLGYEIKQEGKYTSFKHKDWERFARLTKKTLGDDYTEEAIKERIITKRPHIPKRMRKRRITLIIDIETNIKCQASEGYENWAKIHNLQEASKTLNYLIENDVGSYDEMDRKVSDLKAAKEKAAKDLQTKSKDIHDLKERMALIKNYNSLKKYAVEYNNSTDRKAYAKAHKDELDSYKKLNETLKKMYPNGVIPSEKNLQDELDELLKEREELYKKYVSMDEDIENFSSAKENIDRFMHRNQEERQHEDQQHSEQRQSEQKKHHYEDSL
jgi:hypothetical protein